MKILLFLYVCCLALSAHASSGITFHGKIVKASDDLPLVSVNAEFRVRIKSPGSESCLLWEETQIKDLSASLGVFTITIGDPSLPIPALRTETAIPNSVTASNFQLPEVFANGPNYTGLSCGVGTSYSSLSLHGRVMEVSFRETAGSGLWEEMPPTKINYVPLAYQSEKLGIRSADEFLKIASYPSQTVLSNGQVDTLLGLVNGTDTTYLRPSDNFAGDVTGPSTATVVARIRGVNVVATAPTPGQVLKYNGTNWVPSTDDTGGALADASYAAKGVVQGLTDEATSGLRLVGGVISLPPVGTAGTYGSATQVPVMTTDAKGRVTGVVNTTVNDSSKLPLSGGTMTGPIDMGNQNITNINSVAATNFSGRNLVLNDNDTNTVTIRTPSDIVANYILTLPINDGGPGEVLTTDGAGVLSWSAAGSGGDITEVAAGTGLTGGATSGVATLAVDVGLGISKIPQVGGTALGANGVVVANGTGTALSSLNCTLNQVIKFDASGFAYCGTDDTGAGAGFVNNGNSFAGAATLGTNDNFALNFETNNTPRVTIMNDGRVGIGTTTPTGNLHVDVGAGTNPNVPILRASDPDATHGMTNLTANQTFFDLRAISISGGAYLRGFSSLLSVQGMKIEGTIGSETPSVTVPAVEIVGQKKSGANAQAMAATETVFQLKNYTSEVLTALGSGNVGIGTIAPNTTLDVAGAFSVREMAAPPLSPTDQGRIYFDSTSNKFRVSENGGAYVDLVGSGGVSGSGTTNVIPRFTAASALGDSGLSDDGTNIISTRSILAPSGTFSAPAYSFSSDSGLGIYRSGAGQMNLQAANYLQAAGGGSAFQLNSAGFVLIGSNFRPSEFGTAAAPKYSFLYDNDTGLFSGGNSSNILGFSTDGTERMRIGPTGNIGIGNAITASSVLDIDGAVTQRGMAAPALSSAGQGRIYFDSTSNKFQVSQNGGAYTDLVSAGGGGDITEVAAGTGLTGGATSGVATLAVDVGLGISKIPQVGGTALGANGVVVANGTGTALSSLNCTINQVIKFDASGFAYCGTDDTGAGAGFVNNGNSFAGAATLGTNDNFALNFETNGTTKMSIAANGEVSVNGVTGIETTFTASKSLNGGTNLNNDIATSKSILTAISAAGDQTSGTMTAHENSVLFNTTRNIFDLTGSRSLATYMASNNTVTATTVMGSESAAINDGFGNITNSYGIKASAFNGQSTTTNAFGGDFNITQNSSGFFAKTITNAKALNTSVSLIGTGSITNAYGLYVDTIQGTNKWSIYTSDATAPISIASAIDQRGMAAPAVSAAGQGRIYFDSTSNKFRVSQNGGAYADLVSAGGGGDITNGGNTTGAAVTIGTNDAFGLNFETSGTTRMTMLSGGSIGIGAATPVHPLQIRAPNNNAVTSVATAVTNATFSFTNSFEISSVLFGYASGNGFLQAQSSGASTTLNLNPFGGRVGIGVVGPTTELDLKGAFNMGDSPAPGVSAADNGRIYFDATLNKFRVSENGGAYADLVGSGGVSGSGTTNVIPRFTAASTLGDSAISDNGTIVSSTRSISVATGQNFRINNARVLGVHNTDSLAVGPGANNTSNAGGNTAVGFNAHNNNATGVSNTALGHTAGSALLSGSQRNTIVGAQAFSDSTTGGNDNVAIGYYAGPKDGTSSVIWNVYVGSESGKNTDGGSANTFVGKSSGTSTLGTVLNNSTAIGYNANVDASNSLVLGASNVNVGIAGVTAPTSRLDFEGAMTVRSIAAPALSAAGQGRIYFDSTSNKFRVSQNGGAYADLVGAGGTSNVRFPASDTEAGASIAIGAEALDAQPNSAAYRNIAIGKYAMTSNSMTTAAIQNVAIGYYNLGSVTSGQYNVAIGGDDSYGAYPLGVNTSGSQNTAVGAGAAGRNTTGDGNTAVGHWAMSYNTTGAENTYVGISSGLYSLGSFDTAVGSSALYDSQVGYNTAMGHNALRYVYDGTNNVGIGYNAGGLIEDGYYNTIIGNEVGSTTLVSGSGNILIGTNDSVDTPLASTNEYLNIGNLITGNLNASDRTMSVNGTVEVAGRAAPAVSAAGRGRIYFDSTSNKFRVSQNGGAYADLVSAGGSGDILNGGNTTGAAVTIGTNDAQNLQLETQGTTKVTILPSGNVGINVASPASKLSTASTITATVGTNSTTDVTTTYTPSGMSFGTAVGSTTSLTATGTQALSGYAVGNIATVTSAVASPGGITTVMGSQGQVNVTGTGTVSFATGAAGGVLVNAATTVSQATGITGSVSSNNVSTTISSARAGDFSVSRSAGTITDGYGIYIGTVLATNRWSLYAFDPLAPSSFAANVSIGNSGAVPTSTLDLGGAITQRGMAAPALSSAGQGRIYFDSTSNKFQVSQNGGVYTDLVSAGGGGDILNGGNTTGAAVTIGTNDVFGLNFETNGTTQVQINSAGRVGIGRAPATHAKLALTGAVVSTSNIIPTGATVNLALGNIHMLKAPGGSAITLQNIEDGGVYTLFITDTTSRTYTFSGCTNTYYSPSSSATSFRSSYTISAIVDGANTECFITWTTGFN